MARACRDRNHRGAGRVTQATVSMCLANDPAFRRPRGRGSVRSRSDWAMSESLYLRAHAGPAPGTHEQRPARACFGRRARLRGRLEENHQSHGAPDARRRARRAAVRGYRAEEFWLHRDGMSAERFSSMLHHRGSRGWCRASSSTVAPPPPFHWENFSSVRLGVPLPSLTITSVCNDHFFLQPAVARECYRRGSGGRACSCCGCTGNIFTPAGMRGLSSRAI